MSAKSRGGWNLGMCLKDCTHQGLDEICRACIRFSNHNKPVPEKIEGETRTYNKTTTIGAESLRFHPHFNAAFGKYISTKGEYLSEMKKGNFIPTPKYFKGPQRKEYKQGKDTVNVIRAIKDATDRKGGFNPQGALKSELIKRNVIMSREKLERYKSYTRDGLCL